MKRLILALGCCAVLGACSGHTANLDPGHGNPPGQPTPGVSAKLNQQLPAVGGLDAMRSTSGIAFSGLPMLASFHATINGGNELILDGTPTAYAWAIFDLGVQPADFTIGTVNFPNAPDWSSILPLPNVFVGLSIYSQNRWVFQSRPNNGGAADFSSLPPASTFLSASNHSYLAILSDSTTLSFGDQLLLTGSAGPGGELPAKYTVDFPGLSAKTGQNNQLLVKSDNSGGDILTYCATDNGGARVAFAYNPGTDTIAPTVNTFFGAGEALQGCFQYRMDYYSDGRLGIGAARNGPNSIRNDRELSAGSNTWDISTAVDNTVLPATFTDPQFDFKLNSTDNPQVLFKSDTGKLGYAYYVAGSWGIDTGGPDILGGVALRLSGTDAIVAYQSDAGGGDKKVVVSKMQQRPAGLNFGSAVDVFTAAGKTCGDGISLALGMGSSVQVAQFMGDAGGNDQLGFAYNKDGLFPGTWTPTTIDDGGTTADVGQYPSLGVLRDGTPVVAYYDATNQSLRFAISTVPDGGNVTGTTWVTKRIDTSRFGNQVGLWPALGVIHRTGTDPDKVIVAYGVADGTANVLRVILFDAPAH